MQAPLEGMISVRVLLSIPIMSQVARSQHKFILHASATALSCTNDDTADTLEEEIDDLPATPALTDEQILCESLEQLFRVGVPQRRFKVGCIQPPNSREKRCTRWFIARNNAATRVIATRRRGSVRAR